MITWEYNFHTHTQHTSSEYHFLIERFWSKNFMTVRPGLESHFHMHTAELCNQNKGILYETLF